MCMCALVCVWNVSACVCVCVLCEFVLWICVYGPTECAVFLLLLLCSIIHQTAAEQVAEEKEITGSRIAQMLKEVSGWVTTASIPARVLFSG